MFDALNKYQKNDHFFFDATDSLEEACNAPDNKDGVYLVYELKNGRVSLVYVGSSGDRSFIHVKEGLSGLKQSIINGPKAEKDVRAQDWPVKMLAEGIHALDIYWWATYYGQLKDHPETVQIDLLNTYWEIHGEWPRWNRKPGGKRK